MTAGRFVPFEITVCGIEELSGFCEVGVSHVLSILDPDWPPPSAFGGYGEHERLELRCHDIIDEREDLIAPRRADVELLLKFGRDLMREPPARAHLLVHCHAGISRSTASMALILAQARPDRPAVEALAEVKRIRPQAWPNLRIVEMGDALLGRDGELVAAVREHYGEVAARDADWARRMVEAGRGREVPQGL
ncbi:MAG TPA: protein-tyrosine-phosphatase [Alphaproteobacteria bacterium]|nr:protein-tyrosine-phosphatase [Alphaproteobacteria bacterium]